MIGIGYRKDFAEDFLTSSILKPDFVEVAPENWMGIGGFWKKQLKAVAERYPIYCHGLSLSIGSPEPPDKDFLFQLKNFLKEYRVPFYTEHLSYAKCHNAHLYDLLPIPFREDAALHIAARIREVQDYLEIPFAIENVSYYTPVAAEMNESEFINFVVNEAGCKLLLDVNNVYVNAFNHQYEAEPFIKSLPLDQVAYIHMAGHEQVAPDLIIDTHGEPVIEAVYQLFDFAVQHVKPVPVLLERDFNIPELEELEEERRLLSKICQKHWHPVYAA